jgi:uncharacterized protein YfaS (alpha-2-macroglobulin family)
MRYFPKEKCEGSFGETLLWLKYGGTQPESGNTPDLRTTIHWQPVLQTDANGKTSFECYTADAGSSYTILVEGITSDGKIIHQEKKIERR